MRVSESVAPLPFHVGRLRTPPGGEGCLSTLPLLSLLPLRDPGQVQLSQVMGQGPELPLRLDLPEPSRQDMPHPPRLLDLAEQWLHHELAVSVVLLALRAPHLSSHPLHEGLAIRWHFFVHELGYQLRIAGQLRPEEKGEIMSIDDALWELEQLQVVELVVKGNLVGIHRKLTRMDGTVARLAPVFSLSEKGQFPGIDGGI